MKVSVLIPYRYDTPNRERSKRWLMRRYAEFFPEWEVIIGEDMGGPEISRGGMRNDAFEHATGDVLLFNDADTFCHKDALDLAVKLVAETRTWVLPYDVYYNLTDDYSSMLVAGAETVEPAEADIEFDFRIDAERHPPTGSVAGIQVMTREAYKTVGGYDERFRGWGYEDDAFALVLDHRWGVHRRIVGPCFHLWHPPAPDGDFETSPHIVENKARLKELERSRWP